MMKTYEFKSPTGRNVILKAGDDIIRNEISRAGGIKETIVTKVESIAIEGVGEYGEFETTLGDSSVYIIDKANKRRIIVPLPENVWTDINARRTAEYAKRRAAHTNTPGLCPKCETFCAGDCS